MLRNFAIGFASGVIVLVAACGSDQPPSTFDTTKDAGGGGQTSSGSFPGSNDAGPEPPAIECKKMDIVFVIDNSPSMKEEQANLAKNFPGFLKVINEYKTQQGELLDYRIAIATTDDTGEKGSFRRSRGTNPDVTDIANCDPGPSETVWFERSEADLEKYFQCRARVGIVGANVERPLESARLAVTDRLTDLTPTTTNTMKGQSFLRDDALMAFVMITDEDDGGNDKNPAAPLKDAPLYAADFDHVKVFRGRWAAAVIAGKNGCTTPEFGFASKANRLQEFVSTIGKNGVFSDICQGDLTQGLADALKTFTEACKAFPGIK